MSMPLIADTVFMTALILGLLFVSWPEHNDVTGQDSVA